MKFEESITDNVESNGKVKDGGAVVTKGTIRMSTGEGCGLKGCHCSDGYWLSVVLPWEFVKCDDKGSFGKVKSIKVIFDDRDEMNTFLKNHMLDGKA
jgi:hypothetical protein